MTGAIARLPDRRLRLAFFGTPEIARTILQRLLDTNEDDVVLVVCQPDKPKGRGKKLEAPPVKALAAAHGIELHQPLKLKDGVLAARMRELALDLAIVVAYGRILPEAVFAAPAGGTWNVHASLLPRFRGAAPIQHAILAGDVETGVTLMVLTAGLDEGPMLLERKIALTGEETGGALTASLAELGAQALIDGLRAAKTDGLAIVPQDNARATYAPLIEKVQGRLDFGEPAAALARRVRAFDPWPGAFVLQKDGQPLKVLRARALAASSADVAPGAVSALEPLAIRTGEGDLAVLELQPAGKRPMAAADFLRGAGRHLRIGATFPDC